MENKPIVSIIVNCFNGEKYLRHAIESIILQTYESWEIIFWDNKSTDSSADILASFSDTRIRYFYSPFHTKLYEARRLAVEKSVGDYLAFLDVDDTWEPFKLERQIPLFEDERVGIVCGNFWIEKKDFKNRKFKRFRAWSVVPEGYVAPELLSNYFVGLLTLMIRRSAYYALSRQFDDRFNIIGDFDIVLRLAQTWKLRFVSEPIATYRLHEANLSSLKRMSHLEEISMWVNENSSEGGFISPKERERMTSQVAYQKLVALSLLGDTGIAIRWWRSMSWSSLKAKGLLVLLIPSSLLKRLL